jgi:hypothetical protein
MIGAIGAITGVQRAVGLGLVAALAIATGWGARVDHLRGRYADQLGQVTATIEKVTGRATTAAGAPIAIEAVGILRDRYRLEREDARATVERQSTSIRGLAAESARQAAIGVQNRKLAEATMRERDAWIARAEAAETRTVRASAETEVAECEQVLDALYADGF